MLTKVKIKLRRILESDIPQIAKLCNDKTIHDWVLTIPYPYSEADARFFYEKIVQKQELESAASYFCICTENETMIGTITLHFNSQKPHMGMIGYWMGSEYRNKGFMTAAVKEVIRIGFEEYKLKRIYATHKVGNVASAKVMVNAGMEYEGTLKAYMYYDGKYWDSPHYAIINPNI